MDLQLFFICFFTFTIHLIGTLAYSVRIAAVRTRKIALAFALFNVLVLISRTCNAFQTPFLAKRVEVNLQHAPTSHLLWDFRVIIACSTLGSVLGAFLIPTAQRVFSRGVFHFQKHRSYVRLLFHGFSMDHLSERVRETVKVPSIQSIRGFSPVSRFELKMILWNVVTMALLTIGIYSALYAGFLNPEYRVTSSSLSSVINGIATVAMFLFIDPQLSLMTDDVMEGSVSEVKFRQTVIYLVAARIAGTTLAQLFFLPGATLIATISKLF